MVTSSPKAIVVASFAPVRQTLSYGTSPPKIVRPFTPGRLYVIVISVKPTVCVTTCFWLARGTFNCGAGACCAASGSAVANAIAKIVLCMRSPFALAARWYQIAAVGDPGTGGAHLIERGGRIARLQVHAAASIFNDENFEAKGACVEGGVLDAVIGCQAGDINIRHFRVFQIFAKTGPAAMSVVEESAVAVGPRIDAFLKNLRHLLQIELRMKLRALRSLHTVIGPQNLRDSVQIDDAARLLARML